MEWLFLAAPVFALCFNTWWLLVRPARKRRRLRRPAEPEPPTVEEAEGEFTAWTATTVLTVRRLADDGFGEVAFGPARITLDEAADLANRWTGGPYVVIAPAGVDWAAGA